MSEVEIQKIIFPKETVCDCEELYYRKSNFPTAQKLFDSEITFNKTQKITFDTYFNSFSILKWRKFTYADSDLFLKIKLKGSFVVKLIQFFKKEDNVVSEILSEHKVNPTTESEFKFEFITERFDGCFAFSLESIEDNSVFFSASYVSEISEQPREVRIAIGICTYKREQYVLKNMENIRKYILEEPKSALKDKLEIFISDNAGTLNDPNIHHVRVVKNKNTGGSGGFTRCMLEVIDYNEKASDNKITHLLLMDDDIVLDSSSIEKTYKILTLLKPEYLRSFVGGAMLKTHQMQIQYANGEYWNTEKYEKYLKTFNHNRDLTKLNELIENEVLHNNNYQGWWFCAMPMTVIREDNLTFPFFIKFDDIEYSIRNTENIIMMNGINVWHESFESKYSAQNEYYTVRNFLISNALCKSPLSKESVIMMLKKKYKIYTCNYKYSEIIHLCNAINDFLKGPEHFKSLNPCEVHKKVMKLGYKMSDVKDLPVPVTEEQYYHDINCRNKWSISQKKFAKYTINGLLLPSKGYSVLGMFGGTYQQTYRKKFLVRYDISSKKGFILKRSLKKFLKCSFMFNRVKNKLEFRYDIAKSEFEKHGKEMCTREFWNKLLFSE